MAYDQPKIGEFLLNLSDDRELLKRYYDDARSVLADSELTEEQQEIVLSGDVARIQEAIRAEYPERDLFFIIVRPVLRPATS